MKKIRLRESELIGLINRIISEQENDDVIFTPEEFKRLLLKVGHEGKVINYLPMYKGKNIIIKGDLDLSFNKNLTTLGVIHVDGRLDVSNSNIKTLDGVTSSHSWISKDNTPYQKMEDRKEAQRKLSQMEEMRRNDEWNLSQPTDDDAEKAHAAFEYAMEEGDILGIDDDEMERKEELELEIEEKESLLETLTDETEIQELTDEIDELQEELDELLSKVDVYDMYPYGKSHGGMKTFLSLSTGSEYTVGTSEEADKELREYYKEFVDNPKEYIRQNILSDHIDGDEVAAYFEDSEREYVYDSPEDFGITKTLSKEQELERWLLELEKYVYENEGVRAPITDQEMKDNWKVFSFTDAEDNELEYRNDGDGIRNSWVLYKNGTVVSPRTLYEDEDTEEHNETRDERISDIEYEIEEIDENPDGDFDEDEIEKEIEDRLNRIKDDPTSWLDEMGIEYDNFIDKDSLLDSLIRDADYGEMNSYNGQYTEIKVNDTWYIVMRTN
jgi:hypothetical protein